jgi:PAS domain S-box-containing protein
MNLLTIIWSMIASACLTLAVINFLVWFQKRTAWANLLISVNAVGTAGLAFCELSVMMADTPAKISRGLWWGNLPVWMIVVSLVLFIRLYLRSGRVWLAWTVIGMRTFGLALNLVISPNLHYHVISSLHHMRFLGEPVSIAQGVSSPWILVNQMSAFLLVIYAIDAARIARRRDGSQRAFLLIYTILFFLVASLMQSVLISRGILSMPITFSFFSLGIVSAMAHEVSRDVHRSAQLSLDLRQSEARMRDIIFSMGDWVWEVDEKWVYTYSSEKGEELLGHVIGKTPFDLMPPEEANRVAAIFSEIAAKKAPIKDLEKWNVGKDGQRICLLTNCVPILSEAGELKGYRGVDKNITKHKLADDALKENETALRNSKKDLQRLAGRLISAQEEELRRLSRELHDDLTQRLAVLAIEAGKLELDLNRMSEKNPETVRTVAKIKDQLIRVSEDVHTISRQLHPTILDDLGLIRAIESECSAVMGRHHVGITFRKENVPDEISDDIALCLYRVVQESLKNITAHSGAKNCAICLKDDDHILCLTVTDDGRGFDPLEVRSMPGLGLSSMRERVQLIQGDFAIRSQPGKGTLITVCVPLSGGDA